MNLELMHTPSKPVLTALSILLQMQEAAEDFGFDGLV